MKKLPDGWRFCSLKDVVEPLRKITYGIVQPGIFTPDGTLLVRGQDYSAGWASPDSIFRVSEKIETPYRRSRLKCGDIIITIVGAGTGTTAVVPPMFDGANITQTTARIAVASEKANRRYVFQYLNSRFARREVYHYIKGGAQPGLNIEDVERFKVILPSGSEQERIADVLEVWDSCILKLEQLILTIAERKRGLMQQLLTGKTRFKELKGERWRKVRLSDVFEQVTRRNSTGCHRVLTGSAEHGLIDQRDYYSRRVASDDVSSYYLVKRGEFAYNRSSSNGYPFGAIKRLDDYDEGVLSTLYLVFRIRDGAPVDSNFLDHTHEGGLFNAQLSRLCREGARSHGLLNITADEYFSMHMDLPSLAEQRRIEAVLSACDREIELLEKQLEALKEQKRGLMQKLLTGEIRVKIKNTKN